MKDIAGVEIKIGDTVAGNIVGYADLRLYKVLSFTPKKVKLSFIDTRWGESRTEFTTKFNNQVAVVNRP